VPYLCLRELAIAGFELALQANQIIAVAIAIPIEVHAFLLLSPTPDFLDVWVLQYAFPKNDAVVFEVLLVFRLRNLGS
jgi:hypothetical protein